LSSVAGGAEQRVWTRRPMPGEPDDRESRTSTAEARGRECSVGSMRIAPEGDACAVASARTAETRSMPERAPVIDDFGAQFLVPGFVALDPA
jgi:hypothetical protein